MSSATDLITDALVKLGIYAPGETLSSPDLTQGLTRLNDLLDEWSAEFLTVYQIIALSFTVTPSQSAYTIGLVGPVPANIRNARPLRISGAPNGASFTPAGGSAAPMRVVGAAAWRAAMMSATGSTGTPDTLFYDPQYPLGVVNLLPVPNVAGTATFSAWQPLGAFADATTEYVLAPGVEDTLKNNLAVALKSYFSDGVAPPAVLTAAATGKAALGQFGLPSRSYLAPLGASSNAARR